MQLFGSVRVPLALALLLTAVAGGSLRAGGSDTGARWVYLSDRPWERASTGWRAVTNSQEPVRDVGFDGQPVRVDGAERVRGLSTFPPSEIVFRLDEQAGKFAADIGVDDRSAPEARVRFRVLLDGSTAFESRSLSRSDRAQPIQISVRGARELRLVVERADDRVGRVYPVWLDARLLIGPLAPPSALAVDPTVAELQSGGARRSSARAGEREQLKARASAAIDRLAGLLPDGAAGRTAGVSDREQQILFLANDRIVTSLGFGGAHHGRLSVVDRRTGEFLLVDTTAGVRIDGQTYRLAGDSLPARPEAFRFSDVADPALGRGRELTADFVIPRNGTTATLRLALFDDAAYFTVQLETHGGVATRFAALIPDDQGGFLLGNSGEYLADYSRLVHWPLQDDEVRFEEPIGQGNPAFVWNQEEQRALLVAALDESRRLGELSLQLPAGSGVVRVGFAAGASTGSVARSPRFLVSPSVGLSPVDAFADYRRIIQTLYPPRPLPEWVKYQWGTWYTYYMDQNEEKLRDQIDYIADNLLDLGAWQILVDAGWYVAEGRDGADFRAVDPAKFPSGLRTLVDYAHARGIQVILYITLPYLDDWRRDGHWFALRGTIDAHPDWLIPLAFDDERRSYVFDLTKPEVRSYVQEVMADFLVRYGADGLTIDGLGNAEGAIRNPAVGDRFGLVDPVVLTTLDVYRLVAAAVDELKPAAYVQAGWDGPMLAGPYAHAFLYADEEPAFSHPYPMPGLVEHIDTAYIRRHLYGQQANIGTIYDDPGRSVVDRWWLEAGLALGVQVGLGFDLTSLPPHLLDVYRQRLVAYNAFRGQTWATATLSPDVFATTTDGTTFVGLLNRSNVRRPMSARLSDIPLPGDRPATVYEVQTGRYFTARSTIRADMPGEHFRLFVVRRDPGVLWTNSSYTVAVGTNALEVVVRGPRQIDGFIDLLTGQPKRVLIDGSPIESTFLENAVYSYNPATSVLHVTYYHDRPHTIRVEW